MLKDKHLSKYTFLITTLLAITVGLGAGLGAVFFKYIIMQSQYFFFEILGPFFVGIFGETYGFIIIPAIGGLLVGLVIYFGAREAKGHGVPEVMDAMANKGGRIRSRVVIIKTIASALTIGSGGSVGREGPIVQIGSALGSTIGQFLKLPTSWIRTLVACGAAASISATFNTPLAGALFAYELLMPSFAMIGFSAIVISSVIGNVIAIYFMGHHTVFDMSNITAFSHNYELVVFAFLGVFAALVGYVFVKTLHFSEDTFAKISKLPEWFLPVIGGLIVGTLALYSKDLMGVGYGEVPWKSLSSLDQALNGTIPLKILLYMVVFKIIATSSSVGSGASGGVFAPSLFIGAMLGGIFGYIAQSFYPDVHIGTYAIVGGGALFAAVGRAPITSTLMILELTRNHSLIVPVMISVIIATEIFAILSKETIYTAKLVRRGLDILGMGSARLATGIRVEKIMGKIEAPIFTDFPIDELLAEFKKTGHDGLLILDSNNELYGIVTRTDYNRYLESRTNKKTVKEICTTNLKKAYPDQTVNEILNMGVISNIARIPVVSPDNEKELLGIIRKESFLKAWEIAYNEGSKSIL